jgi:acetylglutamate kinase
VAVHSLRSVIKLGGRTQSDVRLPAAIADLSRQGRGRSLVVVHGGGDQISDLQRRLGREPRFVDGRRVTTADDLDLVRMVLSGQANKALVAALLNGGVRALGLSGEDAALLEGRLAFGGTLGEVGTPARVAVALLRTLLDAGLTPVISPVARNIESGMPLNVNGDDAAAAIAAALGASELVFVADVPGVLDARGELIRELTVSQAQQLIASGGATGGMIAKLQAAEPALHAGVQCVRIADIGALSDPQGGTVIRAMPFASVSRS